MRILSFSVFVLTLLCSSAPQVATAAPDAPAEYAMRWNVKDGGPKPLKIRWML